MEQIVPHNWKPHLVVFKKEKDGFTYYETGICEVHYDKDGNIISWTQKHQDISFSDEEIWFSVENSKLLLKKYSKATENTVFIEKTDANGKCYLEEYQSNTKDAI